MFFSQFKPRDVLKGVFFLTFHKLYAHIQGVIQGDIVKKKALWGNIISFEMGKQNIKAKKVYSIVAILYRKKKTCFTLYPITEKCGIKREAFGIANFLFV